MLRPTCRSSRLPCTVYRSHTCGALRESHVGETARLSGWCHRIRDHGGVLFIDLRDHYGMTQCVVDPDSPAFKLAETVRSGMGDPGRRQGAQARRPAPRTRTCRPAWSRSTSPTWKCLARRPNCRCRSSATRTIPEETRLTYRFLDLRREKLHQQHHEARRDHRLAPQPHEGRAASSSSRRRS